MLDITFGNDGGHNATIVVFCSESNSESRQGIWNSANVVTHWKSTQATLAFLAVGTVGSNPTPSANFYFPLYLQAICELECFLAVTMHNKFTPITPVSSCPKVSEIPQIRRGENQLQPRFVGADSNASVHFAARW
jgi:hypothetical protein